MKKNYAAAIIRTKIDVRSLSYAAIGIGILTAASPLEAAGLILNFGEFTGSAASFVNANERVDGETVDNNVRTFSTVGITNARAVLAEDFSTLALDAINVNVDGPPVVIDGSFDLGLLGLVPFRTTISNISIDVQPGGVIVPLSLAASFAATVPATYSWDAELTINGVTTSTRITDAGFFDIELGDLDRVVGEDSIKMTLSGDSQGVETIFRQSVAGHEVTLDHIVFLDRFTFSSTAIPVREPVPEQLSALWSLSGSMLIIGCVHRLSRRNRRPNLS